MLRWTPEVTTVAAGTGTAACAPDLYGMIGAGCAIGGLAVAVIRLYLERKDKEREEKQQ